MVGLFVGVGWLVGGCVEWGGSRLILVVTGGVVPYGLTTWASLWGWLTVPHQENQGAVP